MGRYRRAFPAVRTFPVRQFTPKQPKPRRGCSLFGLLSIPLWAFPSVYLLDIALQVTRHGANSGLLAAGVAGAAAGLALPCLARRLPERILEQALSGKHEQTADGTILVSGAAMSAIFRRILAVAGLILAVAVLNSVTYTLLDVPPRVYLWVLVRAGLVPAEFANW